MTDARARSSSTRWPFAWWSRLARRHPMVALLLIIVWPNLVWSMANLVYNDKLIVGQYCSPSQIAAFWNIAVPIYCVLSWSLGMAFCAWLMRPLHAYLQASKHGAAIPEPLRATAQRRLINFPRHQLLINALLWVPGGVYFPFMIVALGGVAPTGSRGSAQDVPFIAAQFLASFIVSAVVTTFQAFVLLERFLLAYVYPRIFRDTRPAEVPGALLVPFPMRLGLLWGAVSLGPLIVLALITGNLLYQDPTLAGLTVGVLIFGVLTGGLVFWVVAKDVADCLERHVAATHEIARENFAVRIAELRSDEWGQLTDSFNKMAQGLSLGRQVYETLGHFVGQEVRDEILRRYSGPGGSVEEITVVFADIRGFTQRAAGKPPEEIVELLNRFLSLGVQSVEDSGGWVNKCLGDGFMALFGAPLPHEDHADRALAAARSLLRKLEDLNRDLEGQGEARLRIGIGIHTGPALVGCIGATMPAAGSEQRLRLELTAIGETVNLAKRLEDLTKETGETLIFSEATRARLRQAPKSRCLGTHDIRGAEQPIMVHGL